MAHIYFYAVLTPEQHKALNVFRKVAGFSSYKTGSCLYVCVVFGGFTPRGRQRWGHTTSHPIKESQKEFSRKPHSRCKREWGKEFPPHLLADYNNRNGGRDGDMRTIHEDPGGSYLTCSLSADAQLFLPQALANQTLCCRKASNIIKDPIFSFFFFPGVQLLLELEN